MTNCKLHGINFLQTGADNSCKDISFKAVALEAHRAKRDTTKHKKTAQKPVEEITKEGKAILDNPLPQSCWDLTITDPLVVS